MSMNPRARIAAGRERNQRSAPPAACARCARPSRCSVLRAIVAARCSGPANLALVAYGESEIEGAKDAGHREPLANGARARDGLHDADDRQASNEATDQAG